MLESKGGMLSFLVSTPRLYWLSHVFWPKPFWLFLVFFLHVSALASSLLPLYLSTTRSVTHMPLTIVTNCWATCSALVPTASTRQSPTWIPFLNHLIYHFSCGTSPELFSCSIVLKQSSDAGYSLLMGPICYHGCSFPSSDCMFLEGMIGLSHWN